jgi:hypothetical protein
MHDHGPHTHEHDHSATDGGVARRDLLTATAAGALVLMAGGPLGHAQASVVAAEIAAAASAWLDSLAIAQRSKARLAWTDRRREDWHYVPRSRPGVTLEEMNDRQTAAAWALLGSVLSASGIERTRAELRLEGILGAITGARSFRNPANYALVVFGDPKGSAPWSWRFEGHHFSLTVTVVPEHGIAVTPSFVGANPAKVPASHTHAGFRLLGTEEDVAFALIGSLDAKQQKRVVIADRSLGDIVCGPGREQSLQRTEGAPLSLLSSAQRDGVLRILRLAADALRPELAATALDNVHAAGVEALHFAWAGSRYPGSPHYFRVHGPRLLFEYDNTQDGANHVHSVWIDPRDVLGRDLLKRHHDANHVKR